MFLLLFCKNDARKHFCNISFVMDGLKRVFCFALYAFYVIIPNFNRHGVDVGDLFVKKSFDDNVVVYKWKSVTLQQIWITKNVFLS